jgi:acyl-coenzyme A thioesterase PaaI-like protein
MTVFDEATAVRRSGAGRYEVRPDERFALIPPGGNTPPAVNGGVLIATMLRCVLDSSPHPHPVATSAHFLRVPQLAPAHVEVTWLKEGRTAATARASLIQDGKPALEMTITTGTVPDAASDPWPASGALSGAGTTSGVVSAARSVVSAARSAAGNGAAGGNGAADGSAAGRAAASGDRDTSLSWTGAPPVLPPIEECVSLGPWPGAVGPDGATGYAGQVELRLDPATTGWRRGEPAGVPEMRGYFRLREDRDPDAYLLALAVDGLPPVVFGLGASGWAPTVELTWHMRAVPVPGVLRVAARCRHVSGGWFDEEAEVWDAAGRLVAQSRQIARVGRGTG